MQLFKKILVLAMVMASAVFMIVANTAADKAEESAKVTDGGLKIAVVNRQKLLLQCKAFREYSVDLEQRKKEIDARASAQQSALQKKHAMNVQAAGQSKDKVKELEQDFRRKLMRLQQDYEVQIKKLQSEQQVASQQLEGMIAKITQKIFEEKGLDIVMHSELLYMYNNDKIIDITDEMIASLNKKLENVKLGEAAN